MFDSFMINPGVPRRRNAPLNSWSVADVRRLRELAQEGVPLSVIAETLRRSQSAIRNKAAMHGISLQGRRKAGAA